MLGWCVDINVGEMPPMAESLAVVNPSETTSSSWHTAVELDSVLNTIVVLPEIVENRDRLSDSQGMAFNSKCIRVFQLVQ